MIPTSTDVSIEVKDEVPADAEAVVVFVTEGAKPDGDGADAPPRAGLAPEDAAAVRRLFASGVARGKPREVVFDIVETGNAAGGKAGGRGRFRRVIVAGLGKPEKASAESIRQAAGAVDAADMGDLDAEFLVGEAEDQELAWYDPAEIAFLVELG